MHYMTHAKHGKMPVYTPAEIAMNKKHGWVLEAIKAVESEPTRERLIARYWDRFGKAPHHRMKTETIIAKLKTLDE